MQVGESRVVAAGSLMAGLPAEVQDAAVVYAEDAGSAYFSAWDPSALPEGCDLAEYVMVRRPQSTARPFATTPAPLWHYALEVWNGTLCVYGGTLARGEGAPLNRNVYALSLGPGSSGQWRIVQRVPPTHRVKIVDGVLCAAPPGRGGKALYVIA
jgi:hypothetical protein